MTHNEFVAWGAFYVAHPFDDVHRYHRPAAMVATAFGGGDVQARINWLAPGESESQFTTEESEAIEVAGYSDADIATMRGLGIRPMRSN